MRSFYLLVILLSFLLSGCTNQEAPPAPAVVDSVPEEVSEAAPETMIGFELQDPAKVVTEYQRHRNEHIAMLADRSAVDGEVSISGALFYQEEDFAIYNFTEDWGMKKVQFSVVMNARHLTNQLLETSAGETGDLNAFLTMAFPAQTAFYKGNFEEAPEYQIVDYQPLLLTDQYWHHTYLESSSTLYLLTHELQEMPVVASTIGYGGECAEFKGIKEQFVLGETPYAITVAREEYQHTEACELIHQFTYRKVWLEANLLGISEGGPAPDVPTCFSTEFSQRPGFNDFPQSLTSLVIENGDTLHTDHQISIVIMRTGAEESVMIDESDHFTDESRLMIDFKQESDSSFIFYDRQIGLNADHEVSNRSVLMEAEENQSFRKLKVRLLNAPQGLYLIENMDTGRENLFTTKRELFKSAEIEENL